MIEVELGFRAFDAHELLCHLLAERIGLYREAGVRVRLADLTFRDDDALQTSCGAALLGSAVAPARPARLGLAVLAFIGDLAVPTTGLAAPEALLEERPELVAAVAGAHRRALAVVHGSAGPTLAALRELGEGPRQLLAAVRSSFTRDGTVGAAEAQGAVELVAAELREAPFPAAELYDFL